jgi:hypothetical protein
MNFFMGDYFDFGCGSCLNGAFFCHFGDLFSFFQKVQIIKGT